MNANWDTLCTICREVAVEVCGIVGSHKGAPWLRNKTQEVERLDADITFAKQQDQDARLQDDQARRRIARRALQLAVGRKRRRYVTGRASG